MSFFGAVRMYVVGADRVERDLAPSGRGSVSPSRDGAWALWARMGDGPGEQDHPNPVSRVDPGPVQDGPGEMDHPNPVSRVDPGPVHLAHGWSDPA